MVDITEVADGIYRFETPVAGMFYVPVVYLIKESEVALIEPGPSAAIPSIRQAMQVLGAKDLAYIIPTHFHLDHAGGAGMLVQLFRSAKVLVHPRAARHATDPARFIQSTKMVWGNDFEAYAGPVIPLPESQVKIPEDGEIISINGRQLQVIYAPGHAPHHMVILDRKVKCLFCGEALGLPGHYMPGVAPPSFDLETYLDTVEKLRQLGARMLLFSHGGVEWEPNRVISKAAETARVCSDIILGALRQGETQEAIQQRIAEYMSRHSSIGLDKKDLEIIVAGYTIHFESKGLA